MLTEIQKQGIIEHDLNRTKLVNIVNEKYKAKQREKDLRNQAQRSGNQAKKQTR
jgi:hypothetical protein